MTMVIDDPANGGSEAGSWARAIRHTPALAAQVSGFTRGLPPVSARAGEAGGSPPTASSASPDDFGAGA